MLLLLLRDADRDLFARRRGAVRREAPAEEENDRSA